MYRIGGRLGDGDASPRGAFVGIPPLRDWSSNPDREGRGPCQVGSLTGAVASQRVTEAPKGTLRLVGNQSASANAEGCLTARPTSRAGTKVGISDPAVPNGKRHRSTDKSYPGDNRLISPKSSHRRRGLAPRCRLIASWS